MIIRKITQSDSKNILALMRQMPEFFSEETVEYAQEKIGKLTWFIVDEKQKVIWCIVFGKIKKDVAKIYWMAVDISSQGIWIGTSLFEIAEKELKQQNYKSLELITLWDHPDYPWYVKTRKFYEKMWCKQISSYLEHDIELLILSKNIQ